MLYALKNGTRVKPVKGLEAVCPCCNLPVIAKVGKIKVHHWSHKSLSDCPYQGETEWHSLIEFSLI